jgi:hypothetical protein
MKKLDNIGRNLPYVDAQQTREAKSKSREKRGFKDTEEYKRDQINLEKWGQLKWEKEILDYFVTSKPDFPESYWEAFPAIPSSTTTTFRPFSKDLDKTEIKCLR